VNGGNAAILPAPDPDLAQSFRTAPPTEDQEHEHEHEHEHE
jgi:hypothetical protein